MVKRASVFQWEGGIIKWSIAAGCLENVACHHNSKFVANTQAGECRGYRLRGPGLGDALEPRFQEGGLGAVEPRGVHPQAGSSAERGGQGGIKEPGERWDVMLRVMRTLV